MSRAFDAREAALLAHGNDVEKAVALFLSYLNVSDEDFQYEYDQTAEEYIYETR